VAVTETVAGETAAFPCNQWISEKAKDGAEDIQVVGAGGAAVKATFHFRNLGGGDGGGGGGRGGKGKSGGGYKFAARRGWGPPKDEFSGVLTATEINGATSDIKCLQRKPAKVGRCRWTASRPVLKAPTSTVSALGATI